MMFPVGFIDILLSVGYFSLLLFLQTTTGNGNIIHTDLLSNSWVQLLWPEAGGNW